MSYEINCKLTEPPSPVLISPPPYNSICVLILKIMNYNANNHLNALFKSRKTAIWK